MQGANPCPRKQVVGKLKRGQKNARYRVCDKRIARREHPPDR